MITISLQQLEFFAYHGIYPEERTKGNDFVVNVVLSYQPSVIPIQHINETINYEVVFAIVAECMQRSTPLLETLATEMVMLLVQRFNNLEKASVEICKKNPPVEGWKGSAAVRYEWQRGDTLHSS